MSSNNPEVLRINAPGHVGFSATSPSQMLDVGGGNQTETEEEMRIYSRPHDGEPFIIFGQGGKEIGKLWIRNGELSFEGNAGASARMFLGEVVRIASARLIETGSIGPIESDPASKLEVLGAAQTD